ncbi:uncharacterized protein [Physcomitrium patens]|uniref:Uncharacterized protein n=1 Tax=Physcomitrium patens TaxID=3218 RepID=A0A2K1JDE8_PHYPA|nr:uncharacterized protein LOC112292899 [Physcomitrium patens]PNR39548.1 hypothetical protein PHYPA_019826 [Physcomitrium patens]|eukprot:XP_024397643.1 uncharacterized protein LOC112292899 [Physcomitrella patens]
MSRISKARRVALTAENDQNSLKQILQETEWNCAMVLILFATHPSSRESCLLHSTERLATPAASNRHQMTTLRWPTRIVTSMNNTQFRNGNGRNDKEIVER